MKKGGGRLADKAYLHRHYTVKGMSSQDLADVLGVTKQGVLYRLKKFGIKIHAFESQSRKSRAMWKNPRLRRKLMRSQAEVNLTPEVRQRRSEGQIRRMSNPLERKRHSLASRKRFLDPAVKRRHLKAIRSPAARIKLSISLKRLRSAPDYINPATLPEVRRKISNIVKRQWRDPERRKLQALALASQSNRESGTEKRIRSAIGHPHHDVPKFCWAWDLAFPRYKTFVEIQGCHIHGCRFCGKPGMEGRANVDKRKRKCAERNGWRVVYVQSCREKDVLNDPRGWFKREVAHGC